MLIGCEMSLVFRHSYNLFSLYVQNTIWIIIKHCQISLLINLINFGNGLLFIVSFQIYKRILSVFLRQF